MPIEKPPKKKHQKTATPWRPTVSLAVSIALHGGLAVFLLSAASFDHKTGGRDSVPISVLTRDRPVAEASAIMQGLAAVEDAAPVRRSGYRRDDAGRPGRRVTPRPENAELKPAPVPAPVPLNKISGLGTVASITPDVGGEAGDATSGSTGAGLTTGPAATGDGMAASRTGPGQVGHGLTDGLKGDATGRIEADKVYAMLVRKALERQGAYPSTARRLGLEGLVEMLVRIDGSGMLFERRVTTTSGFPQLDEAALASADRLGTLPPPPGGRPIDIRIPVRFSVRRN